MSRDLVILAADKNMEQAVRQLLKREKSLSCRPVDVEIYVHPQHDPGCFTECESFLQPFTEQFAHSLVILDREGCGQERNTREEIEVQLERRLAASGWSGRCATIVLDPELEAWVWAASPEVEATLGWPSDRGPLREHLCTLGMWPTDALKPPRPKEALEHVLRNLRRPRSSALYASLADRVSLKRCTDAAFAKLRQIITTWFPLSAEPIETRSSN